MLWHWPLYPEARVLARTGAEAMPVLDFLAAYSIPPREVAEIRAYFSVNQSPFQPEPKISTATPVPAMGAG
jgi:hypothetical protein